MELARSGRALMRRSGGAGGASDGVGVAGAPFVANAATALSLPLFPALVHLFCRPPRARGKFLFCELRRGASALHLEMEPPADRLRRASSHAGAALWLVGDVDDCVLRLALSDLGWSSRVRGGR